MTYHSKFVYNEEENYKKFIKYKVSKKLQEIKNRKKQNNKFNYKKLKSRIAYFLNIVQSL